MPRQQAREAFDKIVCSRTINETITMSANVNGFITSGYTVNSTDETATLTAAEVVNGYFYQVTTTGGSTLTLPGVSAVQDHLNNAGISGYKFLPIVIYNGGSNDLNIVGGTGDTLIGNTVVNDSNALIHYILTSATTADVVVVNNSGGGGGKTYLYLYNDDVQNIPSSALAKITFNSTGSNNVLNEFTTTSDRFTNTSSETKFYNVCLRTTWEGHDEIRSQSVYITAPNVDATNNPTVEQSYRHKQRPFGNYKFGEATSATVRLETNEWFEVGVQNQIDTALDIGSTSFGDVTSLTIYEIV